MPTSYRVADQLADHLVEIGVIDAFIFIGGANSIICDALRERMRLIPMAHEQAAAMAATYYYRASGRLAPVVVTAGAGCVNTLTGVMAANVDGIPLVVISGNEKSNFLTAGGWRVKGFQGFNPDGVVNRFCKYVWSAQSAANAALAIKFIPKHALEHRQGACWLDIPQDIAGAPAE